MRWQHVATLAIGVAQIGIVALLIWRGEAYLDALPAAQERAVKEGRLASDVPSFPTFFFLAGGVAIVLLFALHLWIYRRHEAKAP